jgi:outer membrane protein OmpA-like peptidoglycan-associated protein/flagellar hook assembly protein FlgD
MIHREPARRIACLCLTASLLGLPAAVAAGTSGRALLLDGGHARSLGRGGTGVSAYDEAGFLLNPASIAAAERPALSLLYGSLDGDAVLPSVIGVLPTSYGAAGLAFRALSLPGSEDVEKGYLLSMGGAKEFTRNLGIGAALKMFTGSEDSGKLFYTGASVGTRYGFRVQQTFGGGFGLYSPSAGVTMDGGFTAGDDRETSDLGRLALGYALPFYRSNTLTSELYNDISFPFRAGTYPVGVGLETAIFERYAVRAGLVLPWKSDFGAVSAGAGYRLVRPDFEAGLDYAFVHHAASGSFHYASVTLRFGELDRTAPLAEIHPSESSISPNYDGRQDFVIFKTDVRDRSAIKGWRLQILDSSGAVAREYRISAHDTDDHPGPWAFLRRIWQRRESLTVPDSILWDGTDPRGRKVADGLYQYSFIAWDERDNISSSRTGPLTVDSTPPSVELKPEELLFSPNGDGLKETLIIRQKISASPDDTWRASFMDEQGRAVRRFSWRGRDIPEKITWDGKDDSGNESAEGVYSYSIEAWDGAGNRASKRLHGISLSRHYETADITASRDYYSPPLHGQLNFFLSLSSTQGLQEWNVTIENSERKAVRIFPGGAQFEKLIAWDGTDDSGSKLPDGLYRYRLHTRFANGNIPSSFSKEFTIDSAAPELTIRFSPSLFSPDGDGENDTLTLYPSARDRSGIDLWNISIFNASGMLFKSFRGTGEPAAVISWDGMDESGDLVESATDYHLQLDATDLAGNFKKTGRLPLPVDVLVMVAERGLKIRISNIEFAFDSANLTPGALPILKRVADILDRYSAYNVLVEGHTDDIGEEEYNLALSEKRSKSVMDYLVSRGISAERLAFRGMGETAPFIPNTSAENRRRNRRVEFLLIRKDSP